MGHGGDLSPPFTRGKLSGSMCTGSTQQWQAKKSSYSKAAICSTDARKLSFHGYWHCFQRHIWVPLSEEPILRRRLSSDLCKLYERIIVHYRNNQTSHAAHALVSCSCGGRIESLGIVDESFLSWINSAGKVIRADFRSALSFTWSGRTRPVHC
jgi:hypothetical protein